MSETLHVYVIAGEPSGDLLGIRLIEALRTETGNDVTISGVGGPQMQSSGMTSLFPMHDLTVMGLAEVLPRIPKIFKRINQTVADIQAKQPDVVVTIDAPDFCLRVAKKLKGSGIPVVHYVAPSVWAWRAGRAKKIARIVDHVMCLLPFEPPYFERVGLDATFVGHSILESGADEGQGAAFRERHKIAADEKIVLVLPGSRMSEVSRLLNIFGDAMRLAAPSIGPTRIVIPTLGNVQDYVSTNTRDWQNVIISTVEAEKYDAFAAADMALAASGTVSLELAMAKVPSIIGYRLAPLTGYIARKLIKAKFASIVNLVLDRMAIPEFIQETCTAEKLADALVDLDQRKTAQGDDIDAALNALRPKDGLPSVAAARTVIQVTKEKRREA